MNGFVKFCARHIQMSLSDVSGLSMYMTHVSRLRNLQWLLSTLLQWS